MCFQKSRGRAYIYTTTSSTTRSISNTMVYDGSRANLQKYRRQKSAMYNRGHCSDVQNFAKHVARHITPSHSIFIASLKMPAQRECPLASKIASHQHNVYASVVTMSLQRSIENPNTSYLPCDEKFNLLIFQPMIDACSDTTYPIIFHIHACPLFF